MPEHDDLLDLATIVGLNAIHDDELADIEERLASAPESVRIRFHDQVRATREAMAEVSAVTAASAPPAVRDQLLAAVRNGTTTPVPIIADEDGNESVETPPPGAGDATVTELRPRRKRFVYAAAAAVAAVAIGAIGWAVGSSMGGGEATTSPAEQVFAAKDVRSSSGAVATGQATVTFSDAANAGVLVMSDVPPPKTGTVYQMWLRSPNGMTSAGTMTDKDVAPTTTAVITGIDGATSLAFTVEPPGGSSQPTGAVVAELPLS